MDKYISVTSFTKYLKEMFDRSNSLNNVYLKGEISNFKAHSRGHYYFTLKDENARINAVMFAGSTKNIKFTPQDGMKVLVNGKVTIYETTGGYQIYVNDMLEDGLGNLHIAFEQLKEKLTKEGLFALEHKKAIPTFPKNIGIITAPTGAAVKDILSTLKRRWPIANTILFPSLVQGVAAASDIKKQLLIADEYNLDIIILGRGGGSIEDMWCFNDEELARLIFNAKTPIISAVGHEIDFTIADFVADLRAPTPTGAAELATPNKLEVLSLVKQIKQRAINGINSQVLLNLKHLKGITDSYILKNPKNLYLVKEQQFDNLFERTKLNMYNLIQMKKHHLEKINEKYIFENPKSIIEKPITRYTNILGKLEVLNPLITIKRGFAIIKDDNDKVIDSVKNIIIGQSLKINLKDGIINTRVEKGVKNG